MGRPSDARQRLIGAAKEVIYATSYEAVTVDELCAAAGVNKSSFYHFFSSKRELMLVALESQWHSFEQMILKSAFADHLSPHEQIMRFSDLMFQRQQSQKQSSGHMRGCPLGNLTLEISTQDEGMRMQVAQFFQEWLRYFERMVLQAQAQGIVPITFDPAATAQALLAYVEGMLLLAKGRNDPVLLATLGTGMSSLMQAQGVPAR